MNQVSSDNNPGCLVGGAIGDALGAPIEFYGLEQIRENYGKNGIADFVEFPMNTGEFTDDTQMTLFTAEALVSASKQGVIKDSGALTSLAWESYQRWLVTQNYTDFESFYETENSNIETSWLIKCKELYKNRAPGMTCISALENGNPGTTEKPVNNSKGCGTIMRMAPVGISFQGESERAFKTACELSALTHGHPSGYLSAGVFASVISDLAVGKALPESIDNSLAILKAWRNHRETLEAVQNSLILFETTKNKRVDIQAEVIEELGAGWVAEEALSMSLFATLLFENDFEKGVLFAVNHSGDSDSTGSITGNLLGLINGIDGIPRKWISNLRYVNIVEKVADELWNETTKS